MIKPSCIIITGPTASGKSALVDSLVERYPYFEIINADMAQCYAPLTIGTAKPDLAALKAPHHLFDALNEPVHFTASQYRDSVKTLIAQINARGNIALLVGGSLFYLKSLFFPPHPGKTVEVPELHILDTPELYSRLSSIDSERAHAIHPNDRYRITRALEIFYSTGDLPSERKPIFDPIGSCDLYFLTLEKSVLHERINIRTRQMIKEGLVEEVRRLGSGWIEFLLEKKIIGYPETISYIEHRASLEELVESIASKTRAYAKRQLTFWRSFNTLIRNVDFEQSRVRVFEYDSDRALSSIIQSIQA